ncbi:MAG: response regulator [Gemmataceae bacterium]
MSRKRILSVGQCGADHYGISAFLRSHLEVDVEAAHSANEAIQTLKRGGYDLVLVNRLLDRDGSRGLDLIRHMNADPDLKRTPVMLISNHENAQQEALAAGALRGFGKAEMDDAAAKRVKAALSGEA